MIPLSIVAIALLPVALAVPQPVPDADPIHIPLLRRSTTPQERIAKLPQIMDAVRLKYGYKSLNQKRSTSTSAALTDEQNDSSYSAVVNIGTPAQTFNLILDTGSSDLWVATNQCDSCTSDVPTFDPSQSSSFKNETSALQIAYGSGEVAGTVAQDNVNFAGFTIPNQVLLAVSDTTSDLLSDGLSGIMGLGFETISELETPPFWQYLYSQNMLSSPVFAFYLERYVNQPQEINAAPGGTFTLGGTNSSLYTGQVEFLDMPNGTTPSYWLQQVQTITVQGKSISIPSSNGLAAIDTGTSLIGAPSSLTKEIWSNVPGAVALTGDNEGMYAFPCTTSVSVSISFGGTSWAISTADMNLGEVETSGSTQMCAGGIFDVGDTAGSGPGTPAWIVGDTFLKNVYSVFQANPPAVGFAQLADGLDTTSGSTGNTTSGSGSSGSGSSGSGSPGSGSSGSGSTGSGSGVSSSASRSMVLSMSSGLVATLLAGFLISF